MGIFDFDSFLCDISGKEEEEVEESGLATFDPMLNTEVEIEHIKTVPKLVRPKGPKIVRF